MPYRHRWALYPREEGMRAKEGALFHLSKEGMSSESAKEGARADSAKEGMRARGQGLQKRARGHEGTRASFCPSMLTVRPFVHISLT